MKLDWRSMALGSLAGALGATAVYAAVPAASPGAGGRAAMEQVVREYILAHPEIVVEAMQKAEQNAVGRMIDSRRVELETPYAGAVAGNPQGDVTLVEFYDYACGYCRASVKDVDRLIAEDKGLRVVFRELPILSEQSESAARASLAAAKAGTFMAFHRAMYERGRVTPADITAVQQATGTPRSAPADPAHNREIERNIGLARTLQISGTPTFVVGNRIFNGAVGYEALKAAIAEARGNKA